MKAICLITRQPSKIWCEFLNKFSHYKVFIIVDYDEIDTQEFINQYTNITFVKINPNLCHTNGFKNTNSLVIHKEISGWDKAVYYFSVENQTYDYVWFIEDDLFFYNESTLIRIDNQYMISDLLSNTCTENKDGRKNEWLWHKIQYNNYEPPYYWAMMCACRMSRNLLRCIGLSAKKYNTLFFLEAAFPIIAFKNNLQVDTPLEFRNIHWLPDFDKTIIENSLYHPIKNIEKHLFLRNQTLPVIYSD